MNREIPKSLRNALARQVAGDVHPSPDVLTSFMERALSALESEAVVHHLAQCAECREIVFVASAAAENVESDEKFVAAAAPSRVAVMPVYADALHPAPAPTSPPRPRRPRWTGRMRWAASIAAVAVAVAGGLVLRSSRVGRGHNAAPLTVASNRPVSTIPETQQTTAATSLQFPSAEPSAPPPLTKAVPHGATTAARAGKVSPSSSIVARNYADQFDAAPVMGVAPRAAAPQPNPDAVAGVNSALVPQIRPQNSFAENETAPALVQPGAPLMFGKSQVGLHAVSSTRPQWRIGPDGHLERSMVPNQWTRVLADQPVTFRAVAATGKDVWAGGNGGALFHSPDGGEHWSKVSLTGNSNVETGAIISIRFDDAQHGVVTSDSGTRWATTDGGLTWLTQ